MEMVINFQPYFNDVSNHNYGAAFLYNRFSKNFPLAGLH